MIFDEKSIIGVENSYLNIYFYTEGNVEIILTECISLRLIFKLKLVLKRSSKKKHRKHFSKILFCLNILNKITKCIFEFFFRNILKKNETIVLTMIGISNSNKTCYQSGCQSRTNACI